MTEATTLPPLALLPYGDPAAVGSAATAVGRLLDVARSLPSVPDADRSRVRPAGTSWTLDDGRVLERAVVSGAIRALVRIRLRGCAAPVSVVVDADARATGLEDAATALADATTLLEGLLDALTRGAPETAMDDARTASRSCVDLVAAMMSVDRPGLLDDARSARHETPTPWSAGAIRVDNSTG